MQDERECADSELVAAAQKGNKAAFAELLQRHRPLLIRLCVRLSGSPDFAEEVAQEAALQAMLNIDRLQKPAQFSSWLSGIGLNVARTWLRQKWRDVQSLEALEGGRDLGWTSDTESPEELV